MRIAILTSAALLVVAGAVALAPIERTRAQGPKEFVFSASDGYGVGECLTGQNPCGRLVADAWCESNGYARAHSWRRAEAGDVTASTGALLTGDAGGAIVVTCGD